MSIYRKSYWLLAVFCLLGMVNPLLAETVTRGPYLQLGTPTSIVVRWRTDVATNSQVQYGSAPGSLVYSELNNALTTEHSIKLTGSTHTGLNPDTTYYYSVGTSNEVLAGADANHFFVTSPESGVSKPTRIWVLGDSGTADSNAQAVRNAYYNFTGTRHTDLWLMLGDNAYENGTDAENQAAIFNMYPAMLRKSVLWPARGNHDSDPDGIGGNFYAAFTLPTAAEAGGVASGREVYYSFDYGNIHFICLESTRSSWRAQSSAMWEWLEDDLAANNQQWTIAYWHHPPYSKGPINSDTHTPSKEMRERALPRLEQGGVDLVLTGHAHAYERSFLLDGHYGTSSTLTDDMIIDPGDGRIDGTGAYAKPTGPFPHAGAVYAVAGSSGKTSSGTLNHPVMIENATVLGSMVLDIDANRLDAKFIDSKGRVQDYFTIDKGSPIPDINIDPVSHDYGNVIRDGGSADQTFVVSNTGSANLNINIDPTTALSGPDAAQFSIISGGGSFTLASHESHNIVVRFDPDSIGSKSASLVIASDDPDENPLNVPLSGTGVTTLPSINHEQTVTGVSSASASVSTSTAVTGAAGHLYLAAISSRPNVAVSSVSGLGLAWMQVASQCSGRNATGVKVWKAQGTPTGNGAVTANLNAAATNAVISVSRYSGVSTTNPIGNMVIGNTLGLNGACSGGTDSSAYSINLTTTSNGAMVYGAAALRNKTHTSGTGYTERSEIHQGSSGDIAGVAAEDRSVSSASTVEVNGTFSGTVDWAVIGLEIKPP